MTDTPVETPSGKGAADENFPVGSWLLPPALRPHVATYYAFSRAIDDISDNPALAAEDKFVRLAAFEAALTDPAADRDRKSTRLNSINQWAPRLHTSVLENTSFRSEQM